MGGPAKGPFGEASVVSLDLVFPPWQLWKDALDNTMRDTHQLLSVVQARERRSVDGADTASKRLFNDDGPSTNGRTEPVSAVAPATLSVSYNRNQLATRFTDALARPGTRFTPSQRAKLEEGFALVRTRVQKRMEVALQRVYEQVRDRAGATSVVSCILLSVFFVVLWHAGSRRGLPCWQIRDVAATAWIPVQA